MNPKTSSLSQDLVERSLASVWHPCTQMKHHEQFPLVAISHGKGAWLYDHDGNRYLDAISSWWVNLFGHANPSINQALKDQLDSLEHVMLAGFTHKPVVELSERLSALTQHQLGHTFYASDGASAIEMALKMSFHYWQNKGLLDKKEFICLKNSYHGETLGALAVTDIAVFKETYGPLTHPAHIVANPDARLATGTQTAKDIATSALKNLEELLSKQSKNIAALIVEPLVQCASGMVMHDPSYLQGIRKLCDQYQIHLIADEIAVGCGRTGTFFAVEQAGIWPDFLALSKGISGGYLPLSLVMTTDEIYEAFYHQDVRKGFLHSHSYTGNPLACRAALATLDIFEKENILEKNKVLAQQLAAAFAWTKEDERIIHFRQAGMILAFDIKAEHLCENFAKEFFAHALNQGVLVRPIGSTIYIMPPYIISADEITHLSKGIQVSLNATVKA
ncbi:adenosylmethionine--8-amino-7-oxononanoate transaminase [Polynucleobacter sp. AM-26B4]|uniref:adenosylmethionine--8-amino-7-oxononanoate transaminase n=1 Tax=Polynucleobacter sp. AM-26B4 TaxID=2689103 RepID=UPI001C0BEDA1|nr:adenosylmethionine--8-amino-7-oxononanoate transaminase [Polynucleobacter sp. AM-26B4]MBU3585250.1 adenosylmethionine--8-amino-7-oxononanoate transaminase [Polynucleobacter sp. AM-26B4]